MDTKVKEIEFRIGMNLHKIAMSVPDPMFQKIKPYMEEIEEKVLELVKIADEECKSRDRQEFIKMVKEGETNEQ